MHKDYWAVEIALPFASLEINTSSKPHWGINLARENHKANEYSCTSPVPCLNFHAVKNYSLLVWDDTSIFKDYLISFSDVVLRPSNHSSLCTLEGKLHNSTRRKLKLKLTAEIEGKTESSTLLKIKPRLTKLFSFGSFPRPSKYPTLCKFTVVAKDGRILREEELEVSLLSPISATTQLSYYTTEKEAKLHIELNFPRDYLRKKTLRLKLSHYKKTYSDLRQRMTVSIPIADLPLSEYQVQLALLSKKKELHTSTSKLLKLKPSASEVKVDRIRRIVLVDGKPFLPFAPLVQFFFYLPRGAENVEKVIEHWSNYGFRSLIVVSRTKPFVKTKPAWQRVLDSAHKRGMKIIFWTHHPSEEVVNTFKDHPALLAWLVDDEPEIRDVKPEELISAVEKVKRLDPYHPAYINFTRIGPAQRWGGLPGDILSTDYYLTGEHTAVSKR